MWCTLHKYCLYFALTNHLPPPLLTFLRRLPLAFSLVFPFSVFNYPAVFFSLSPFFVLMLFFTHHLFPSHFLLLLPHFLYLTLFLQILHHTLSSILVSPVHCNSFPSLFSFYLTLSSIFAHLPHFIFVSPSPSVSHSFSLVFISLSLSHFHSLSPSQTATSNTPAPHPHKNPEPQTITLPPSIILPPTHSPKESSENNMEDPSLRHYTLLTQEAGAPGPGG